MTDAQVATQQPGSMRKPRWTAEQAAAIEATGHRLLVANAGTGKTTTVVGKVLWLLGEAVGVRADGGEPIAPCPEPCTLDQIAAITFTEKAAYDLRRKLREEIAESPRADTLLWELERASVGTIHSFCGQLLREHALRMGIDPGFRVLDEQDARAQQDLLLRDIVLEHLRAGDAEVAELVREYRLRGFTYTNGTVELVREAFRDLRWHRERYERWCRDGELDTARLQAVWDEELYSHDLLTLDRCRGLYRLAAGMLERWREFERDENVRDFDSLVLDARDLLTSAEGAAALAGIRRRYRILIIDEFQDTDGAQRDIAYAIAGLPTQQVVYNGAANSETAPAATSANERAPQLFLVGDPKQSIYRFRGADISVWNAVARDMMMWGEVLPLSENFRSDPVVVEFVNAAAQAALAQTAMQVQQISSGDVVEYTPLRAARSHAGGIVEWIQVDGGERREAEAAHVAHRISEMVGTTEIVDPKSRQPRPCRYSDIAVLYRTRTGLAAYTDALRKWRVPFYEQSPAGLAERQEILDLLNLLRLLDNPNDDLRAFAFLRSPFVGLRDEVLARIRLESGFGSFLQQAKRYLDAGEWFDAPEHPEIVAIERDALRNGLETLRSARSLANRIAIDELIEYVLERTAYRQHLLLLEDSREALANISGFLHLVGGFRDHSIGRFLQVWDSRRDDDPELPQGQLCSAADDVVTLSTIHAAKGLEWPIVFLIDASQQLTDRQAGRYWSDPELGPILCPPKDERGTRAHRIAERNWTHESAEAARLLYVVATRARDRLIVLTADQSKRSTQPKLSHAAWLMHARHLSQALLQSDDAVAGPPELPPVEPLRIELAWLQAVEQNAPDAMSARLPRPVHRWTTSATEQMTRAQDPRLWEKLYLHGIEPVWQFAPRASANGKVPERLRGDIIHGVLERIQEEVELAQILEETIGEIDMPELESALAPGAKYRDALENEILRVLSSDDWAWYTAPEHHRELPFLHLAGEREWRMGAFDLYRPDGWIIDFKTHQIDADRVPAAAAGYTLQMAIYRAAAAVRGEVRTRLHFTHPGVVVDVE